jgi:hypothetical protein
LYGIKKEVKKYDFPESISLQSILRSFFINHSTRDQCPLVAAISIGIEDVISKIGLLIRVDPYALYNRPLLKLI